MLFRVLQIKLADFGFARHFTEEGTKKPIDMHSLAGTPVFMVSGGEGGGELGIGRGEIEALVMQHLVLAAEDKRHYPNYIHVAKLFHWHTVQELGS